MKPEFRHWHSLEVRWGDLDALEHVNNACYFTYLESARLAYLDEAGIRPYGARQAEGPILARVSCNFRNEIIFPSSIEVGTRVVRMGRRSFELEQGIFSHDRQIPFADSESVIVWFDYQQRRSVTIPDSVRKQVSAIEQDALGSDG